MQDPILDHLSCLLHLLRSMTLSQSFLSSLDLNTLEEYQIFLRMFLSLSLSDVFLGIRLRLWIWGARNSRNYVTGFLLT